MKIFRITIIKPAGIILAIAYIFLIFSFNSNVKKYFETMGENIFAAKVDIRNIDLSIFKRTVEIKNIQIGDKDSEFNNILQIENIKFHIKFIPLLSKKFIIDNVNISGVEVGTKRKTSSKLPEDRIKEIERQQKNSFESKINEVQTIIDDEFSSFPNMKKFDELQNQVKNFSREEIADMTELKSTQLLEEAYVDLMKKYDAHSKIINDGNIEKQIAEISQQIEAISTQDIKTNQNVIYAKAELDNVNKKIKDFESLHNEVKNVRNAINKSIDEQRRDLTNLNKFINEDVDYILARLSISQLNFGNMSRVLFAKTWMSEVDNIFHYMNLLKMYIPQDVQNVAEIRNVVKGRVVKYPRENLPELIISDITFSRGRLLNIEEGKDRIAFSGMVKDVSSNQNITGTLTSFEIQSNDEFQVVKISGTFDRVNQEDKIEIAMDNISLSELALSTSDYTPSFKNAKAKIHASFLLKENSFESRGNINIKNFEYDTVDMDFEGLDPGIVKSVKALWGWINAISINANISIADAGEVKTDFTSDVNKLLEERFGHILYAAIGDSRDVKERIRNDLRQYIERQRNALQNDAENYRNRILRELDVKLVIIQRQLEIYNRFSSQFNMKIQTVQRQLESNISVSQEVRMPAISSSSI